MGVRLQLGECFGILLTRKERAVRCKTVEKRIYPYLYDLCNRSKTLDKQVGKVDDFFLLLDMMLHVKKEGEWDSMTPKEVAKQFLYNKLLFPQKEFGSIRFFGLIGNERTADPIDYCLIVLLRHACEVFPSRIQINDGHEFTFTLPSPEILRKKDAEVAADLQKFEIAMGTINMFKPYLSRKHKKLGKRVWIPHPRLLMSDEHLTKAMVARGKELNDEPRSYFFDTEEECKTFLDRHYHRHDWYSTYYQSAWQLISKVYPEVPLDRVKRYLVGWWA